MFSITTVVFDGPSPPFISQTLRDGTPQVQPIFNVQTFFVPVAECVYFMDVRTRKDFPP